MSETITRLKERRANVWEQMKALADTASNENRAFSGEEQKTWDTMNAELDALDRRASAIAEGEQRAKDIEDAFGKIEGRSPDRPEGREVSPFGKWAREARHGDGFDLGLESRDLTKTTASAGVPVSLSSSLWEYMIETASILGAGATILNTASGEELKIPRATAHSASASVTEGAAITESDPTIGSVSLTVAKAGYFVQVTKELLTDVGFDLEGYMARAAGRELGNAVGSNAVTVLSAAASAGVTGATGTTTTFGSQSAVGAGFDYLIQLYYSVIAPYRNSSSCGWVMSDATAAKVRQLKSTDGLYAWQPSVQVGQPDLILGKPVHIDTSVADPAASAKSILFGDLSSLYVRLAGGFRFERDDSFAFNADMSSFRALVRHGAVSVDANAVKSFVHSAT